MEYHIVRLHDIKLSTEKIFNNIKRRTKQFINYPEKVQLDYFSYDIITYQLMTIHFIFISKYLVDIDDIKFCNVLSGKLGKLSLRMEIGRSFDDYGEKKNKLNIH